MDATPGVPFELVETALEAAVAPEKWQRFLSRFARELQADVVNLVIEYPRPGENGSAHSAGCTPDYAAAYSERLVARDPWREVADKLPEGAVSESGALDSVLEGSGDFYRDWLAPQGLRHGLGAVLYKPDGLCRSALIGLRRKAAGPFASPQRELMQRLTPHLQRALAVQRELQASRTVRDAALETLDRLPEGWILLGSDGSILANNRSAERMLAAGDGVAASGGRLMISEAGPAERLRQLLARTRDPRAGLTGATLELASSRGPLRAVATPLRSSGPGVAVLFVSGGAAGTDGNAQRLRETYGLTHAEARVAGRLAEGQRLSEIARDLGISINTVRGHLKQVFAKTGTHRQAELVRLVLSGPVELQSAAS